MKKIIIFFISVFIITNQACDSGNNGDEISEYILSAEVTNKLVRNVAVNNTSKEITFELARTESRTDVNIKLTLAGGVIMASPKWNPSDYNLMFPAEIELSANGRKLVFTITAGVYDPISEFILSAELTNKQVRNMVIDNASKEITFDLAATESKTDVNIKLTLAEGVSMVSPESSQADYNLTTPAEIKLLAEGRQIVFTVKAGVFTPLFDPATKGWVLQTSFGTLKDGIWIYKSPPSFKGKNIVAYIALGSIDDDVNFHLLGNVSGSRTPTQFYNDENQQYPVVINGSYFWWNGSANHNVGLMYRNGVMVAPGSRSVIRSNGTADVSFYPTKGAFSDLGNKQYRTDWTYTTASPEITYAYPAPAPNKAGTTPCPVPSSFYPAGGWVFKAQTSIGAGPVLTKNGVVVNTWEAETWDNISGVGPTANHPRSAIGFTNDNRLLLFVCEGRNQTPSTPGLTLQEVAELLLEIGCIELLNLDGGGSSCMLVNGQQTIKPSDGSQRSVVTAIGLK